MRKFVASILILTLPFILGCEKRLFNFVATVDQTSLFSLSSANGQFDQAHSITMNDLEGKLDIPSKAHVTDVLIESIFLRVTVRPQNQAQAVMVNSYYLISDPNSNSYINGTLSYDQTVHLAGVEEPFNAPVNEEPVANLKFLWQTYIISHSDRVTTFHVRGQSIPAAQQVALDLQLVVRGTVKYEECVETIQGTGGDKCDDSTTPASP
ncbi:MAG: hypothetical protein WBW16_13525 [Bacteroidota bacterium]